MDHILSVLTEWSECDDVQVLGVTKRGASGVRNINAALHAMAAATLQRKAACLRSFYRHLRREGTITHDPTAELRGPRKTQKLPAVLSRDEVNHLLGA